jgi:hypothetical protein
MLYMIAMVVIRRMFKLNAGFILNGQKKKEANLNVVFSVMINSKKYVSNLNTLLENPSGALHTRSLFQSSRSKFILFA